MAADLQTNMKQRTRVAGIIIKDNNILLMERVKNGKHYWVFPGGGKNKDESYATALRREIMEESGINIAVLKTLYKNNAPKQKEIYFKCRYISGEPKLSPDSVEYERTIKEKQFYSPQWKEISYLPYLDILPHIIRDAVVTDFATS